MDRRKRTDFKKWSPGFYQFYKLMDHWYFIFIKFQNMCQCVCCDCIWLNYCGAVTGLGEFACCIGWWCCSPESFPPEGKKCCFCFEKIGMGSTFFCCGGICCAPEWLVGWSKSQKWALIFYHNHFQIYIMPYLKNSFPPPLYLLTSHRALFLFLSLQL